ncbi:MAG TPA: DUF1156 domain-containing protein [Candidatus Rifleibacterium sp.]|nr:DUF1156 domain-containing protein [Candidatus Rifleibacterium sp.]
MSLQPFAWKDKPALIECLLPVQKISAESFKEQMSNQGKTLTALGSYWKGRKPLILNKACILGALLPFTDNALKDLEIFEILMGMDRLSITKRLLATLPLNEQSEISQWLSCSYGDQVKKAKRPEELAESELFSHAWKKVNDHLGTSAQSFSELIEEIGIARFGRRPKIADVFCGSGQIPFEAARLGCDVYASDLNPIACLLTWGAFNIVGGSEQNQRNLEREQDDLIEKVQAKIDKLGLETDGNGWRAKAFLYCVEVVCPESGWKVPLLPSLAVSKGKRVIAELVPDATTKSYKIEIKTGCSKEEVQQATIGTVQDGYMVHSPDGVNTFRISINSIRGDYKDGNENKNKLRFWEKSDFIPRPADIFQERLYCVQWMQKKSEESSQFYYEFRSVTADDLARERKVIDYLAAHLAEWQEKGYVPDMVIEKGYNTDQPIRERGWTHWHHLFNPRQLLLNGLLNKYSNSCALKVGLCQALNRSNKLCVWDPSPGVDAVGHVFYNQALNTLFSYGTRSSDYLANQVKLKGCKHFPFASHTKVESAPAALLNEQCDVFVTDPPYGDAVKYEEITEFFIAWLRKNPPEEFAHWTWDSRRSLAIKGEDEGFRRGMIAAYRRMAEKMPDNGIQVLMFTHQSGSIWADMANIIWASGLQVTAAWYIVTETDSALRQGANVTGTNILILRKRHQQLDTFRDDLGWEIEEEVKKQVEMLTGLDRSVRNQGSEGIYNDADLHMAGYAAALRVLTAYAKIDGKDMMVEAEAPRVAGSKTFVDELIEFAVQTAVKFLVPIGFESAEWQRMTAVERFYLKMAEMEHQGNKTLDNYINFAKAFKVRHYDQVMSDSSKANSARLKLSTEFKSSLMSGDSELAGTPLRALLYAMFEVAKEVDTGDVLLHLMDNCPNYLTNKPLLVKMAGYLAEKRAALKPGKSFKPDIEASAARILADAIANQRL